MDDRISVVIPAYNVGIYIERCLDSVFSQTYRNLEVIVVNDGSTDNTAEMIQAYSHDPRLRYISQRNAGVSAARNAGIDAATGKFLTFVDSDDYLETDMYEKLYIAISGHDADMAVCDYNLVYDDRIEWNYSGMLNEKINISEDVSRYFYRYCACPKPNNYIWVRLYKTDIVKKSGIRFENYKLGDDTLFNFMLLPHISHVVNISGGLYNYFQRYNSNVYTVAKRSNLAKVYAETFSALADYYKSIEFEAEFLPIHAYTRLRSIIFYSRLAGMPDEDIAGNVAGGFDGTEIKEYLKNQSQVGRYAEINNLSVERANKIKHIMRAAAEDPRELIGVVME